MACGMNEKMESLAKDVQDYVKRTWGVEIRLKTAAPIGQAVYHQLQLREKLVERLDKTVNESGLPNDLRVKLLMSYRDCLERRCSVRY